MRHKHPTAYLAGAARGDFVQDRRLVRVEDLPFEFMMNALRSPAASRAGAVRRPYRLAAGGGRERLIEARKAGFIEIVDERVVPTARGRRFLNELLQGFLPTERPPSGGLASCAVTSHLQKTQQSHPTKENIDDYSKPRRQPDRRRRNLSQPGAAAPALKLTGADLADVGLRPLPASARCSISCPASIPRPAPPRPASSMRKGSLPEYGGAGGVADLPFAMSRFCAAEGLRTSRPCPPSVARISPAAMVWRSPPPACRPDCPGGGGGRRERQGHPLATGSRDQGRA